LECSRAFVGDHLDFRTGVQHAGEVV